MYSLQMKIKIYYIWKIYKRARKETGVIRSVVALDIEL
jgi:hypothetical protein